MARYDVALTSSAGERTQETARPMDRAHRSAPGKPCFHIRARRAARSSGADNREWRFRVGLLNRVVYTIDDSECW